MSRPPDDPADHAEEFAPTWVDRLENSVEGRMHALDIPEEQIGSSDHEYGVVWRCFFPYERTGGGNATGGRISVDSGVLNPKLNAAEMGPKARAIWEKSRLRDRIDATIVHEYEEAARGSHEAAVAASPDTLLPLGEKARHLLRVIAEDQGRE